MKKHILSTSFLLSVIVAVFLNSCTQPYEEVKNRTWLGGIYRYSDEKRLSLVLLKMSHDTLYLFSNAIFGADNDTLILQKFNKRDSTFTYISPKGNTFSFRLFYNSMEYPETLDLLGDDYYIMLNPCEFDIRFEGALSFYQSAIVPRESYMYLDGAYEGNVEMENVYSNLVLDQMGSVSVKMVFIDGFQVKIYWKNLLYDMFAGSANSDYELVNYKVDGNTLLLGDKNSKYRTIEVREYGETLVMATDKASVILHKIY